MQQMRKELGYIAEFIRFESMDRAVLTRKGVHVRISPAIVIQEAKACRNQPIVAQKGTFLGATLNQHVDHFLFAT